MTFDELNVTLSQYMEDKVSTAPSNGRYSSAFRVALLNDASRNLHSANIKFEGDEALEASVVNSQIMRSYISEETQSLSDGEILLTAFTGGVAAILAVWNAVTDTAIKPLGGSDEAVIRNAGSGSFIKPSNYKQYYMVQDGKIVLVASTANNSDSITLMYVKPYTDLAVGGAILFPVNVHTQILNEAFKLFCMKNPTADNVAKLKAISGE
jgi:hypothetical protein